MPLDLLEKIPTPTKQRHSPSKSCASFHMLLPTHLNLKLSSCHILPEMDSMGASE